MIAIFLIILGVPMIAAGTAWLLFRQKPIVRVGAGLLIGPLPIVAVAAHIAWNEYSPDDPDPITAFVVVSLMALVVAMGTVGLLERYKAHVVK